MEGRCQSCTSKYTADRLDIWKTANAVLKGEEWDDGNEPSPIDVLHLAIFLAGEMKNE